MLYQKQILKFALPIIALLAVVSRLPQLLSPELFMDGDECIVGLMAKHYLEGKDVPYFFYGQSYGFSFIEVFAIRIFYSVFGVADIAVKSAMLFLWTTGILFFYQTLKQIGFKNNPWLPLLITLVFIFSPAWGNWAMKARGGYLTAFVFTFVITYLMTHKKWNNSIISLILSGFIAVIIYQSQPLFLAGLAPILIYQLYQIRSIRTVILFSVGLSFGGLMFYFIKDGLSTFWSPQVIDLANINMDSISSIPEQVYKNLTGSYLYDKYMAPVFVTQLLAVLFGAFILITLMVGLFYLSINRQINPLFYAVCISVLGTISYVVLTNGKEPRYLLPLIGYAFFMVYLFLDNLEKKRVVNIVLGVMILLGGISMYDFKNHRYESKSELVELVNHLESKNIHHIYCTNGLLQWQVMFYSNERIIARYISNVDRYQEYITQVDSSFAMHQEIAMAGYHQEHFRRLPGFVSVNDIYYMFEKPTKVFLIEQGFNMK